MTAWAIPPIKREFQIDGDEQGQEGVNRREFLTYAWASALGLLTLETGLATYQFMRPRFNVGEFGGLFSLGTALGLPKQGVDPIGDKTGKFWLINTKDGPRALYMVCTHLGCLFKWEASENHFKCPCHNSMFTREGLYIAGPTSRSLDQFVIEVVSDGEVVSSTEETGEVIRPPSIPSNDVEIVVNTGRRIRGHAAELSPARVKKL